MGDQGADRVSLHAIGGAARLSDIFWRSSACGIVNICTDLFFFFFMPGLERCFDHTRPCPRHRTQKAVVGLAARRVAGSSKIIRY